MPYRFYRRVRYRNPRCTDGGANFGTDAHTDTGGTCIDVVPNLPKCSVPLLMRYRAYRRVRYRHYRRTELTEVSGIGNTGGIYRWYASIYRRYASVRTVPNTLLVSCVISSLRVELAPARITLRLPEFCFVLLFC